MLSLKENKFVKTTLQKSEMQLLVLFMLLETAAAYYS